MNKTFKYFAILIVLLITIYNAMGQPIISQKLDQIFKDSKECYFRFPLESKSQVQSLSKIISIDKIDKGMVYAYASRVDFEAFLQQRQTYELLDHPHTGFQADMYNSSLKKTYDWNQYLSYSDYVTLMYQFAENHPDICQVFSLGTSVEGRELLVAKISDNIDNKENEPQFLYTGQIHGDELVTSTLFLRLIDYLTANYETDNKVKQLVDEIEIWINPLANPDGLYAGGNETVNGATRFNANAVDINRNFPDLLNGDHPDGKAWQKETEIFMALAEEQNFVMSANTHAGAEVFNYPWDRWVTRHADNDWWQLVAHEYADTAQYFSSISYMVGFDDGTTNGYDWYSVTGGRQDYMNYFQHCRETTIEQSTIKMVSASQLTNYWDYNKNSLLNYLKQVTYGFKGRIIDFETSAPLLGNLEIENHDMHHSDVFSNADGYYFRPIKSGVYNLIFSADGYETKRIENQTILDYDSKTIDVALKKLNSGLESTLVPTIKINNPVLNKQLQIESSQMLNKITIYNTLGQLVLMENLAEAFIQIDLSFLSKGVYIIDLKTINNQSIRNKIVLR